MSDKTSRFSELQKQIDLCKIEGKPFKHLVKQQIKLLEQALDQFRVQALAEGYSLQNPRVGEIEVRQYSAMKQLAAGIGEPTDRYDLMIKKTRIRIFGEENYERFFG